MDFFAALRAEGLEGLRPRDPEMLGFLLCHRLLRRLVLYQQFKPKSPPPKMKLALIRI